MAAYNDLLGRAGSVSNLPFQTYGGQFVAPVNAQQQQAGANINQYAGFAQPFIQQAAGYATQAAQPITAAQIQQYQSPYTQQVVNATEAQFNNQNAQQLNQVRGNAAAQGALGGDREAVAEAITAGQQQTAEAPVIAGLYNSGYNTALSTALQEQQNLGQSAYSLGNLGVAGQNAALTGANAQLGYGTLQQSTQQALDQALYNQFLAQQAYPFQTTQWLAGIDTGVGSQMGGTSSTTGPAPNQGAQWAGLGLAALSFLNRGGGIHRDAGGRIRGFDMGGTPYAGGASYVPTIGITGGQGAPRSPGLGGQGQQQIDPFKLASSSLDLGKKIKGLGGGGLFGSGDPGLDEVTQAGAEAGLSPDELGFGAGGEDLIGGAGIFRRGGRIAGFAAGGYADGGGEDSFEDRFSPSYPLSERLERSLGLGDVTGAYPVPSQDVPLPRSRPGGADDASTDDYVNPLRVNGQSQNLTGPIIPPGGFGGGPTEPLPPAQDVADRRVSGLGDSALSFAPDSGATRGYSPVPGTSGAPSLPSGDEKQSGFGGLFNNPLHLSDDMRKAMLAAGFGMLASRSPFLGNAIGEGGLAGLSAYSGSKKEAFNEDQARQKLEQHAEEFQKKLALDTKKLEQARELAEETRSTPKKIGTDQLGQEVYAVRQNGKWVPIDSTTGQPVPEQKPIQVGSGQLQPAGAAATYAASEGARAQGTQEDQRMASLPPELAGPAPARNEEFLQTVPADARGTVKGIVDYRINPASLSVKGGHRERLLNWATQYDPDYDQRLYNSSQRGITEFTAGGNQSPAGIMTNGNTALLHAKDMSDAIEEMRAQPGILNDIGRSGYPIVSYAANKLNNRMVQGTPEGAALSKFITARQRFTEEVTKFYSGTGGSEAERDRAIKILDDAKSLPELRAAIAQDAKLMKDKVDQMANRLRISMSPQAWRRALVQDPEGVILYQNSRKALDDIMRREAAGANPTGGGAAPPAGAPQGARQAPDGHFYVPDPARPGKYLMVQ